MTTVDVPIFKDRPDMSTPVDAAHLTAWGLAIKANADAAEVAAVAAGTTTDAIMAAKVADAASLTRGALAGEHAKVGRGATTIAGVKSDFAWMRYSRWGFMVHYVQGNAAHPQTIRTDGTRPANVSELADEFDVDRFVSDVASWGVDYVIFTVWHHAFNLLYPSAIVGAVLPDHVSTRDVIQELIDGLKPHGIRLILYFDPCALSYTSTADQDAIGFNDPTGSYAVYKAFLNSLVTEMGNRYGTGVDGYWLDMVRTPTFVTKVDTVGFRTALLAGNASRLVMGNAIDDEVDVELGQVDPRSNGVVDIGTREYASFMGKPAAIADWLGGYSHTITLVASEWWAKTVPTDPSQLMHPVNDFYRFTVLQAGTTKRAGGLACSAGPYAGLGLSSIWEPGIEAGMAGIAAHVAAAGASLRVVTPSRSFQTLNTTKIADIENGLVATTSPDGLTEYLHVLNPPVGALTVRKPKDSAEFKSGINMRTGRPVSLAPATTGGFTITLDPADSWDTLHTIIQMDRSPANPYTETVWLPATVFNPTDANPTLTRRGSYTPVYQLPDAVSSTVVTTIAPPPHWQEFDVVLYWLVTTAATAGICYLSIGQRFTPIAGVLGTSGEVLVVRQIPTPSVADQVYALRVFRSVANNGLGYLRFNRWGSGAPDTSTQVFGVVGVELRRTR